MGSKTKDECILFSVTFLKALTIGKSSLKGKKIFASGQKYC